MTFNLLDNSSDSQNSEIKRRRFLESTGTAVVVGLAGCSGLQGSKSDDGEDNIQGSKSDDGEDNIQGENNTDTEENGEQYSTGIELHNQWIHGETPLHTITVKEFIANTDVIQLETITNILEESDDRVNAVGQAVKNASEQFRIRGNYEERHRHIMSALDQAIESLDGEQWDFNFITNMNYTQTVGETIQYSEIKVPTGETTESGHDEYAIINGALSPETDDERSGLKQDHAVQIPGEEVENVQDQIYKQTMRAVRKSSLDGALPPHDVETIENRAERVNEDEERWLSSTAPLMGYQLFAGGSEVDSGYEFKPDQILVPATKEIHEMIDEIGYEQGDRTDENGDPLGTHGRVDLQLAINEEYFNKGYDEIDGPVVIDNLEETSDGWDFELREEPDWTDDTYPAQ